MTATGEARPSAAATKDKRPASLWHQRNFMLLWGGQTVSEMGSAVTQLALPAGAIVDRMRKRRIMIWCDLARVALIGSIPVAAALGALIGGALGTAIGIRPTIWIGAAGSLAAGLWVFFSPLRTMRDV